MVEVFAGHRHCGKGGVLVHAKLDGDSEHRIGSCHVQKPVRQPTRTCQILSIEP